MLGNQSNSNKPVYRNARLFGPNCSIGNNKSAAAASISSNSSNKNLHNHHDSIEEDFSDYMKTENIPEMKILPMEYVAKVKSKQKPKSPPPPPPKNKCKCLPAADKSPQSKQPSKSGLKVTINAPDPPSSSSFDRMSKTAADKYLVYKRKHSIFGTSKDSQSEKLKYVSDNDKASKIDLAIQDVQKAAAKEGKRKYLIFDSKKNSSSKFETIQYYFDNKSYEKYVDTKLYGKMNQISSPIMNYNDGSKNNSAAASATVVEHEECEDDECYEDDDLLDCGGGGSNDMKGFENSRSWEYRDNAKTESKLKMFESKQQHENNSAKKKSSGRSDGSTSGASTCSEVSLKRQNVRRLNLQQKFSTSKSIDDLSNVGRSSNNNNNKSNKMSHDVKRINQLFENAKQNQVAIAAALKSNLDNKEKYKIHKKVRGGGCDDVDAKIIHGDDGRVVDNGRNGNAHLNVKKYHRSSTDLSIKLSPQQQSQISPSTCGFKNCKLSNCPVSHDPNHHHNENIINNPCSSSSSSAAILINERRGKFDENFIKKFEDMRKNSNQVINNNCVMKNNEITVNKTNISVNGKSNIIVNDMKNNFTPSSCHDHDVFIINGDCSSKDKEVHLRAPNNHNNNKTTIKINDSCFVVNHSNSNNSDVKFNNEKNKNIIELNNERATNWDKNIRVKNNPQPKFNNKIDVNNKIKSEENSVKIYVIGNDSSSSSPTPSAALSLISTTPPDSSASDSDKDDGYYDASSQGRSSSPEFSEMFKKLRDLCASGGNNIHNNKNKIKHLKQHASNLKFGCDGTFFWNNSFFDEDETDFMLTKMSGKKSEKIANSSVYACTKCHTTTEDLLSNYICICRNKVRKRSTSIFFFLHLSHSIYDGGKKSLL